MLIRLNGTTVTVFTVFVLVIMLKISYGDDYCAKEHQRAYYKYGETKAHVEGKKDWTGVISDKAVYGFALKYAEDDLAKCKHLKERTSNGRDYDFYKGQCECIEGAIRLIKKTSYADMWKIIIGK